MRVAAIAAVSLMLLAACAGSGPSAAPPAGGPPQPTPSQGTPSAAALEEQRSGTTKLLQAVSPLDANVVWVSGHGGTWLRTTDGGGTWAGGVVPGADSLEFRDVHAASATEAWLLSAGPGDRSRVYHTSDAGRSWQLQWTNQEPAGFYDCLSFWDGRRGIVYGDAVDGALRVLRTEDGGRSWRLVPSSALPAALAGEGGFAASGTCVATGAGGRAWIAAGNAARARVFRTSDYGATWSASDAPVGGGEGAGLTSISMVDENTGTAFGGNLAVRDVRTDNVVRTTDGGRSWTVLPHLSIAGAAYGGTHVPGTAGRTLVVVGPGGADVSFEGAQTWATIDSRPWWGIGSAGPTATWITGPEGRIARIRMR
jgi:photosystem II stability/assembly factor-like uncharacterized protein